MTTLNSAASQLRNRPADESFTTLQGMYDAAHARKFSNRRAIVPLADLRVSQANGAIHLAGTSRSAPLSPYAFGQLCTTIGAPARYIAKLPTDLQLACLSHSLTARQSQEHADYQLLLTSADSDAKIRAITSAKYARVWTADILRPFIALQDTDPKWELPLTWDGSRRGAYSGDRSDFLFMVDGGSVVDDPSGFNQTAMHRGFIVRNSEVGDAPFSIEQFLFRVVCGNHIIWDYSQYTKRTRRHVGKVATDANAMIDNLMTSLGADFGREADEIAKLATVELAKDRDGVIDAGRKAGLSAGVAEAAYNLAETNESNPRSVWGYVQGVTRASQTETAHADDRHEIDQIAGWMLTKARRQLATV